MGIISYAQNFEDVLLWRALGHIEHGCYIDIGAHDPIVDSVSKAFHEHGWRGIHLEPLPVYCDALRRDRPDETVLQAAVAAETGILRFFEIPDTGISTGDEAIAQSHRERGFRINEITVPCVTLAQVFQLVKGDVVHWLKIDVEGLEEQVLQGWGESSLRPWVVVIESTLPLTQDEVYSAWEGLLLKKGYLCVYFDGLNRYYLGEEHSALEGAFRSGPNVFDGFQFSGTANNPFCGHIAQSIRNELEGQIESLMQQVLQYQAGEQNCAIRLKNELEHSEKLKQTGRETEAQLRHVMQREQEFTVQLLAGKDQLQQLGQAHSAREKQLQEQLTQAEQQARQESEAHLRNAVEREQAAAVQLLELQQQAAQALAQQARELQSRHDERTLAWETQEKTFRQEISNLANEVQALRHASELQTQQHGFVMDAHLSEHQRLIEAYAALESRFKAEIAAEQQNSLHLHQSLAEVQQILDETHASFTWRWTAPLRAVFFLFTSKQSSSSTIAAVGENVAYSLTSPPVSRSSSIDIQNPLPEQIMLPSSATTPSMATAIASTLDELLAYHDSFFVVCAYRTLLGRGPDPEGQDYYLRRLRAGYSKVGLLKQLRQSPEGQASAVNLPGLDAAVWRYELGRLPVVGRLFRLIQESESDNRIERMLRTTENRIFLLETGNSRRIDQLERELENKMQTILGAISETSQLIRQNVATTARQFELVIKQNQTVDMLAAPDLADQQHAVSTSPDIEIGVEAVAYETSTLEQDMVPNTTLRQFLSSQVTIWKK